MAGANLIKRFWYKFTHDFCKLDKLHYCDYYFSVF
jgi:hypothetical protein